MKHKFKIYGIVLLCLFSLSIGCSKDDYQTDQQRRELGSKISFEQFKNETGLKEFKTSIQVKRKKNGTLNKNADGSYELTDFDIDTDVIKKMELNQNVGYTFKVHSKDKSDEKMYNMVMFYKDDKWESIIVALRPTPEVLDGLKLGHDVPFNGDIALIYDSDALNRGIECFSVVRITTANCPRVGPCEVTCDLCAYCIKIVKATFCGAVELTEVYESMQDTEGNGSGYSGTGPGTGTHPETTPDQTIPIGTPPKKPVLIDPFMEYVPEQNTPCATLKNLVDTDKANLKPEIQWLQTRAGLANEFGVEVQKKMQYSGEGFDYPVERVESPNQFNVDLSYGESYVGSLHSHPIDSYAMFSFGDVRWLLGCYQSAFPSKQADVFTIVVCKDDSGNINTYALKINDIAKLTTEVNAVWNNPDYAKYTDEKERTRVINDAQAIIYSQSGNQLEKSFLQQFGAFGIDLYKASDDLGSWNKLKLSTTAPLEVKSTPCN